MARTPTSVRLSDTEKRLLKAAAQRRGTTYGRWIREAALEASVDVLEEALPDLQSSGKTSEAA